MTPDGLQAIVDACKAGASDETLRAMAEQVFGYSFKISFTEKRINAGVICLLVLWNGGTREQAEETLWRNGFANTRATARKIATGNAGSAVTREARQRFDAMSNEERDRTSKLLEVTSTLLEVSRAPPIT